MKGVIAMKKKAPRVLKDSELSDVRGGIRIYPDDPKGKIRRAILNLINNIKKKT